MKTNPILLEVFKHRFASIAEEMGVTLNRTAFSPNIKERRDFSCAVFNETGELVAQAAHIPVHLGSMPLSVASAIEHVSMQDGDMVVLNDPFMGGTHLPDITLVAPVFFGGDTPQFYVANRAHHADVGGMSSGSMPLSRSIFQEGIVIPSTKFVEKGHLNQALMQLILANVRTPVEREGDFEAQIMANLTGIRRIRELASKHGLETTTGYAAHLIAHTKTIMKKTIAGIPDGTYAFEDMLEDDGCGNEDILIKVTIDIKNDAAIIDFTGSHGQVAGSVNAVFAVTLSAVLYVFRSLVAEDIQANAGCLAPLTVKTEKGSIVDAQFPAPVAGGNVETSQRIVDVLLGALSKAIPEKVPAASQGTMNNVTIGGMDKQKNIPFAYYETIGGGMGATASCHGESAVHSHMTNTLNTPIEALEYSYPFRVTEYSIRQDSGGKGTFRGGNGIVREIQLLSDAEVTVISERRRYRPFGLNKGEPGKPGRNQIIKNKTLKDKPGKFHETLSANDIVRIETPGGGGYGKD